MALDDVIQQIKNEIDKLSQVLSLLTGIGKRAGGKRTTVRRKISAAGRKRIAAAQRARWAKIRAQRK